ncbi:PIN domain-containing protein [Duganella sp. CT11-25]|uniref:PIN domain-containing protein n=1 Tax=unclassified Duganella TaxID=2636909 RepID=UPI0039AF33C0
MSAINWIEVTCALTPAGIVQFDQDLADAGIVVLQTTPDIMRRASEIRSGRNLLAGTKTPKLPDCIIWATAEIEGRTIVTRNPDDFGGNTNPLVRVPYKNIGGVVTDVQPLPE